MKWVVNGLFALIIFLVAHDLGFRKGQESVPAFIEALAQQEEAEERRHEAEMERISGIQLFPTREECIPIMEGVETDVFEFCSQYLSDMNEERWQNVPEPDFCSFR